MVAASHTLPGSDAPGAAASAAVLAFLQAVTAVFAAAWSEQQQQQQGLTGDADADDVNDDAASNPELVSCLSTAQSGSRLRAGLAALAAFEGTADTGVPSELVRCSVKIGQDVVLRLDRLEKSTNGAPAIWSVADLGVLAERLEALIQRALDIETSFL